MPKLIKNAGILFFIVHNGFTSYQRDMYTNGLVLTSSSCVPSGIKIPYPSATLIRGQEMHVNSKLILGERDFYIVKIPGGG